MTGVLRYLLQVGVGLSLFHAAYRLFLKKETYFRLNRVYLLSSLFLSFLLPAIRVSSPFVDASWDLGDVLATAMSSGAARSFDLAGILAAVYFAGALVFLARLVFRLAKLVRMVREFGVRREEDAKIVMGNKEFSPFSFLDYIFINDGMIAADNLPRILAHERIHIRQHHSLDILLLELAIVLQWFNPFVWSYKKSLQETHEYLADSGVVAQGFSPVRYQLLVFEQHLGARLFEFGNSFKQSRITRRIMMMSTTKSKNAAKLKPLLALPLTLFLLLAFADPKPAADASSQAAPGLQNVLEKEAGIKFMLESKAASHPESLVDKRKKTAENLY